MACVNDDPARAEGAAYSRKPPQEASASAPPVHDANMAKSVCHGEPHRAALMLVGLVRDLLRPTVYEGLESCLLGQLRRASSVSVFFNLGYNHDAPRTTEEERPRHLDEAALRPVLLSLQPRFVTVGEPDAPVHLSGDGLHRDSRCGGCAWPPDALFPWQRQLQLAV